MNRPDGDENSPEHYCRAIESYLCRKNDGHLVRIVGPAFEQVCGWATQGVPLTIACSGIDRYFERYYAKGPRRRPVRVEFCEADVLDAFDQWRRAVGVSLETGERTRGRSHDSLPAHLERVIARLTALRAGEDRAMDDVLAAAVAEIDRSRGAAGTLRGEARTRVLNELRALDARLLEAARTVCSPAARATLNSEAESELAPFRDRMPPADYERSLSACADRLVRERFRLPVIAYDA